MTLDQFRSAAMSMIQKGEPLYGVYFVDHNDRSVYNVTRWLNAPSIACDELFTPESDRWPEEYRRACDPSCASTTLHIPKRSTAPSRLADPGEVGNP